VDCHVAKVAQSATTTWRKPCHISKNVGPKLQGRKTYLNL